MSTDERRARGYAAKFRAETICAEPPQALAPTDANLARLLQTDGIVRKARNAEFPAIRAALEDLAMTEPQWATDLRTKLAGMNLYEDGRDDYERGYNTARREIVRWLDRQTKTEHQS